MAITCNIPVLTSEDGMSKDVYEQLAFVEGENKPLAMKARNEIRKLRDMLDIAFMYLNSMDTDESRNALSEMDKC